MSTTPSQNCPECGAPIPPNAKAGLCPRCVMDMNLATQTEFTGEPGPHGTKGLKQVPSPEELAGKFPQLQILELLGRGGMGAVYKARQKELDRVVALKILPPEVGEDPAFAERFAREAKALARLNHPNIVTLYEFGRADGLFFFLMECVDGVNLRQLLNTGRVSAREALAIVPQICDALQYAHDQGIVHRDIKPENILMDRRGRVKVADFGLAKLMGADVASLFGVPPSGAPADRLKPGLQTPALTDAGKVMGTPQYMAPEQMEKPAEVDHRADIYALGVVFYQMLTGELPGKRIEPPSKKVQIDVRLDEIVLRALEEDPERRYEQASVLKTQVETIATSTPQNSRQAKGTPEPSPTGQPASPPPRYNPWEPIITVIGTIIFIVLLFAATDLSPGPARILFALCTIGLIICGLTFAGLWPVRSPWFPEPNFSSRNLRRGNPARSSSVSASSIQKMLDVPSIGLLVMSSLSLLLLAVTIPLWVYGAFLSIAGKAVDIPWAFVIPVMLVMAGFDVVSLTGAWRMRHLRSYTLAVVGSILFILTPGLGLAAANACRVSPPTASTVLSVLLALLFGSWSLIVLSRRDVREAFDRPHRETQGNVAKKHRRAYAMLALSSVAFLCAIINAVLSASKNRHGLAILWSFAALGFAIGTWRNLCKLRTAKTDARPEAAREF